MSSVEMKKTVDESLAQLQRAIEIFPWQDKLAYGDWLAQTYYYVRHSTRLLAVAAGRMPMDPVGDAMHIRFSKHIGEEERHETLCIHDLKKIGLDLAAIPERAATRMFWEPQYYKVEHEHPALLMGYILVLEAMASVKGPWILSEVEKAHGPKSGSFIKVHAEEDLSHVEKAYKAIESLPPELQTKIVENLAQTTQAYVRLLQDCASSAQVTKQRSASASHARA